MYSAMVGAVAGELARQKAYRDVGMEPPPLPALPPEEEQDDHCSLWVAIAFIFGISL